MDSVKYINLLLSLEDIIGKELDEVAEHIDLAADHHGRRSRGVGGAAARSLTGESTMSDSVFEMQALMPSEEDIAHYQRNGYYVSKEILSAELIAAAWEGSERLYRCEYDERFAWSDNPRVDPNFGVPFTDRSVSRADGYASFHSLGLRDLARLPIISAIAAALIGAKEIRYWKDQLIYKPPARESAENEGVIGFHQDKRYWATCKSNRMITALNPTARLFDAEWLSGGDQGQSPMA